MALESRETIAKPDLCFKLHNVNKIHDATENLKNTGSFLAVSPANGLLFVGDPVAPQLKVFFVSDLVKSKATGLEVLARTVPLPGRPNNLACNCDGSMIAINYNHSTAGYIQIYSVPSFISGDIQTVYNLRIMPDEKAAALQILWSTAHNKVLAAVLDNGYFAVYELKDGGVLESQMHKFQKQELVQCACWSPRGKQIALGFANGRLQLVKRDLSTAKTIICPPGIYRAPFDTAAISWLSVHQFIVAFVNKSDAAPAIFIVNASKGDASATYIRQVNVCASGSGPHTHQVHFTHLPLWNLLLVASGNSWNIDLLSANYDSDLATWKYCEISDDARLEIPQSGSRKPVYPIGVAFDTASTHQLTLNDQLLPPMPMIHFLSTQGQLVSYDFVNLNKSAPRLCTPPPLFLNVSPEFQPINRPAISTTTPPLLSEKALGSKSVKTQEVMEVIPASVAPIEMTRMEFRDVEYQAVEEVDEEEEPMPCWQTSFISTPRFLVGSAIIVGAMFAICLIILFGVIF